MGLEEKTNMIKEKQIKYDGRWCTSRCGNDIDCPHEEKWGEYLKDKIFDLSDYDERVQILNYLDDEGFEDISEDIKFSHCMECLGSGNVGVENDGNEKKCYCSKQ